METIDFTNSIKIAIGGDSEVYALNNIVYKKWRLPFEQVRLYQRVTDKCTNVHFLFDRFEIKVLPLDRVFKKDDHVFSVSKKIEGTMINNIQQPDKQKLGFYFQRELTPQLSKISNSEGINIITWNAMLMSDNKSVWITDIASDVSSVSISEI